jgi:hypothetical protein
MSDDLNIDEARSETATSIAGCLTRLSHASRFLTTEQRIDIAEKARNLADALDEGKVITVDESKVPRRHFVRTHYRDATGAPLFREVVD